ncbi:hypothetical protein [Bacillus sp. JJ722]|uniref:hypothetical protein n=1 Tax=Bacillus sp. JJ722 TaxID=3122973 RepID=UPI002FFE9AC0
MKLERKDVIFIDARDPDYEPEVTRDVMVINGTITLEIYDDGGGYFEWVFREITGESDGITEVNMDGGKRSCFTANLGGNAGIVAEILKMSVLDFAKLMMENGRGPK